MTPKVKTKVGKAIVDNGATKVRYSPLEDAFALVSMLQINLQGRQVGAYVLRQGLNNFMIHFGFECKGIHATLRTEETGEEVKQAQGIKFCPQCWKERSSG